MVIHEASENYLEAILMLREKQGFCKINHQRCHEKIERKRICAD